MLVAAISLAVLTFFGLTTPLTLMILTFALGLGAALNAPAWQAIMPELIPRQELPQGVAMRQHARFTNEDRAVQEKVHSYHRGETPPLVRHLIAEDVLK